MEENDPRPTVYDIRKYKTLREFLNDDEHTLIGLMGPFGSGKSSAAGVKLVEHGSALPPMRDGVIRSRYIMVRNTYRELQDTTIKTFFYWFPPLKCGEYNESKNVFTMHGMNDERGLPFDAEFYFRALDRPDHVGHLLSFEFTGGWINEAREVPFELVRMSYGRAGRYPPKNEVGRIRKLLVLDSNPPDETSEWFKFFESKKRPKFSTIYKQPSARSREAENLDNLQHDYYSDLIQLLSDDEIKVYVDGQYGFIRTGRPVYPAYNDNLHCKEFVFDKRLPIWRGWDFGLTPACIMFQVMPTGQVRVGYEFCAIRAGIDSFSDTVLKGCAQEFKGWRPKYEDIGDPAGNKAAETDERSCFDILHGKGVDIRGGESTWQIRFESVDLALRNLTDNGEPQLIIHPRCQVLRKGFMGGYQYRRLLIKDAMGELRYSDEPDKNRFSHPHDALNQSLPEIFGEVLRDRDERLGSGRGVRREQQTTALGDFDPFNV